jgi:predicted nucleic acid-binding protein
VKWLLDTDTVIYYMKEMPAVVERLEATRPRDRFLSLITLGETLLRNLPFKAGGEKSTSLSPIHRESEAPAVHSRGC